MEEGKCIKEHVRVRQIEGFKEGLEEQGQRVSKQDIRVEQKVSVALLASRDDNCLGGGSEDETIADSREGERERKMTCGGVLC